MTVRAVVVVFVALGALVASSALVCGAGCVAVALAVKPAPQLFVDEEAIGAGKGAACGADVDVQAGRLPDGAVVLARYHVTTSQPVPLQQVLDLLASYGRRRCADGVRVVRADVADGSQGMIAAEAVAYVLPTS